jgi:sialate O-acetylesterase
MAVKATLAGRFIVLLILLPLQAGAQLQLAPIFSDNMILQRDQPVHVWGKAAPGVMVTVSLGPDTQSVIAKKDSSWLVDLGIPEAVAGPLELAVRAGSERIVLQNIIIGDVWLCIGQSNMEFPMMDELHFRQELQDSGQPLIRFYNPVYAGKQVYGTAYTDSIVQSLVSEKFYRGCWQACDSNSFKAMSAVAYYFGKAIREKTDVPVGLINLSIGGAPLETFIDRKALAKSRRFSAKASGDWLDNDALPVWIRERGRQNVGTVEHVCADRNGKNHPYKPGFAWASGMEPILPLGIRGIICYQGESNAQEADRVNEYAALSKLMVEDYRRKWKDKRLPFYFVQLSSIDTVKYNSRLWPQFRNEQRKMTGLIPYCGMAVCSDAGARDDVHPSNKKVVGERLARWALNKTYSQNIVPSGPLPVKAVCGNGRIVVTFRYTAGGLTTSDGNTVKGFSLDGKNEVEAFCMDTRIVIHADKKPAYVYYGWKPFSEGNLVNSQNLPASTFKIKVR